VASIVYTTSKYTIQYLSLNYLKAKTDDTKAEQAQSWKNGWKLVGRLIYKKSSWVFLTDYGLTSGQTHIYWLLASSSLSWDMA